MLYTVLKTLGVLVVRFLGGWGVGAGEKVRGTGPVLGAPTPPSLGAPPLVAGLAPRQVSFMAKAELFDVPLLGGLIRRLGAWPVRREGGDPGALRTALCVLREGGTLLVFPEGTRGEEGVLRPPKLGAGMLAVSTCALVVPAYGRGSGRAWARGRLPRPGRITV